MEIEILKDMDVFGCIIKAPPKDKPEQIVTVIKLDRNKLQLFHAQFKDGSGESMQYPILCKEYGKSATEFIEEIKRLNKNTK